MDLESIIEEFKSLNYEHFNYFYNETKKSVFFAIASIVKNDLIIDDLIQDTYIKFLENIDKYQKTSIKAYLSKIAHNIAINYYNREKRIIHDEELLENIPSGDNDYQDIKVLELLDGLLDIEKEIVVLHVINELKFKDIAKIVEKPLGTVLWIYNKAMKELKRKVGALDE